MGATPVDLLATVLAYDDARGNPVLNAPHSGYQRIVAGPDAVDDHFSRETPSDFFRGVDPAGLIEVAMDDETRSGHASVAWSRVTVTALEIVTSQRAPGSRLRGHDRSSPLPW